MFRSACGEQQGRVVNMAGDSMPNGEPAALGARAIRLLQALGGPTRHLAHPRISCSPPSGPDVLMEKSKLPTQISAPRRVLGGDVIATIPWHMYTL